MMRRGCWVAGWPHDFLFQASTCTFSVLAQGIRNHCVKNALKKKQNAPEIPDRDVSKTVADKQDPEEK